MADFEVTSPQGQKFIVTAPDGATQDQVLAYAQSQFQKSPKDYKALSVPDNVDPTEDMSFVEKFNAGMGKAFVDIGEGAQQLVGLGPNAEEVRNRRALDAPLMKTGAGLTGNIAGNLALIAPATVLPGAATIPAAGAIGASVAALQPTETPTERLGNMGIGFGLGAGSQWAGTTGARLLGERAAANQKAAQIAQVQNEVRDRALDAGRRAGYVVPPSTINPTLANSAIESVGGKIATQQQASVVNQKITDTLGRESLGLRPDAPLTEQIIGNMRKTEGRAYEAIKNVGGKFKLDQQFQDDVVKLGGDFQAAAQEFPEIARVKGIDDLIQGLTKITARPATMHSSAILVPRTEITPSSAVELVKKLRFDATKNFKAFADPEKLALARAQREAADALEGLIERNLATTGQADLVQSYRSARVQIAKLHDIEAALTPGGHIDARVIAKIGESKPLSGPLRVIADFAGNFGKAVQTGEKVGSPMVHALRPSIGSAVGGVIGGVPGAAIGGAAGVTIPWLARGAMLSGPGQSAMATPSYSAGFLGGVANAGLLPSPQMGGLLSRTAVPAIYMGLNQR